MVAFDFESKIASIPDYPEPGVVFKDITPLLSDGEGFSAVIDAIADHFKDAGVTKVVGAEARGFMIGAPVAYRLNAGFVPARKPGKLPRATLSEEYELEYGVDRLEIHADALCADDVVLLVQKFGARLAGLGFLMELEFLEPRTCISRATDADVFSLVKVR